MNSLKALLRSMRALLAATVLQKAKYFAHRKGEPADCNARMLFRKGNTRAAVLGMSPGGREKFIMLIIFF